jgi:Protein of unknown function (DUF4232)
MRPAPEPGHKVARMSLRAPGRLAVWILLAALVLTAASCGGGGSSSSTSGSTSTATSAQKPSGASASSAATRCQSGDVRIGAARGSVATGHVESPFLIRNTSGRRCTLRGFPTVTALGEAGKPLSVNVKPTAVDFFPRVPNREVALPPGGLASFRIVTTNGGQSVAGCPKALQVKVVMPQESGGQALPFVAIVCPGTVTVSRVAQGKSAYLGG